MKLGQVVEIILLLSLCMVTGCQPSATKLAGEKLKAIDEIVAGEIGQGSFPGAVVLVGRGQKTLYRRAFGSQMITPREEAMSEDTVFDIASLTKPVATAASIMILRDRGKIRLNDYVRQYLPAFGCEGKEEARIEHLLTHTSGLPAYTSASELKEQFGSPCPDKVIEKICGLKAMSEPGQEFQYSCLGYITLAKIVEIVSGKRIDQFTEENIFAPLKMNRTIYNPPESWNNNVAATEVVNGNPLRGMVHDPLAQLMDGVSGNAGVFSTADDLAVFCRMLLSNGTYKGKRILSPKSIHLLTAAVSHGRACGFDVQSSYSWIKGANAPKTAFCHSGYTGTSIVCDPEGKIYVIILTNRAHPEDKGTVKSLRTKVADVAFEILKESR